MADLKLALEELREESESGFPASGTAAAASRPYSPALSTIRFTERRVAIGARIAEPAPAANLAGAGRGSARKAMSFAMCGGHP